MTGYRAKIVGGDPSLDFLNTIHDWTVAERKDHIATFADAICFAQAAGVLTRTEARSLAAAAPQARREIESLRELRTLLERVFRGVVSGSGPRQTDLDQVARVVAQAATATRLLRGQRGTVVRAVDAKTAGVALIRWRLVDAAVRLLTSQRLDRVKACPGCGWFFLDASKNNSRRWCSMDDCGSITKSRRYYRRKTAGRRTEKG